MGGREINLTSSGGEVWYMSRTLFNVSGKKGNLIDGFSKCMVLIISKLKASNKMVSNSDR